jgi:hypothetical protein
VKDFASPPASTEIFTERNPTNFTGNPVGAQYLNRFLRDVGSFNLGVPGQGNLFPPNVGADEKAAPTVVNGSLVAAQDALGIDYNSDGKGIGFNPPSVLGISSVPPYLHNGAAENLFTLVTNANHRTAGGRLPDHLTNIVDQISVFAFLETIDAKTVPFVPLSVRKQGNQIIVAFDSVLGVSYAIQTKTTLGATWTSASTVPGTGQHIEVPVTIDTATRFLRLTAP